MKGIYSKINEVKKLISQDKTGKAIEVLKESLTEFGEELEKEIIIHSSIYERIVKDLRIGLIDYIQGNEAITRVNYNLIQLLAKVEDDRFEAENKPFQVDIISEENAQLRVIIEDIEYSIKHHLKTINNWSKEIKFRDMSKSKNLSQTYIELDFYLLPVHLGIMENHERFQVKIEELVETQKEHILIFGQPGAGKTTTIKKLIQSFFQGHNFSKLSVPVLIRLRTLNNRRQELTSDIILKEVLRIIGINFDVSLTNASGKTASDLLKSRNENIFKEFKGQEEKVFRQVFENFGEVYQRLQSLTNKSQIELFRVYAKEYVDSLNILILLDGLDELHVDLKTQVLDEITQLTLSLNSSKIILTSRLGELNRVLENTAVYEICPLDIDQQKQFVNKWMGEQSRAQSFYGQLMNTTFAETAMRPLTLAHLCAIFDRYHQIPEKPKTVYDKILNLLLEEWDTQRGIVRVSKYAGFSIYEKKEFLSHLSFILTTVLQKVVFSRDDLISAYKHIYRIFGLPHNESKGVVKELESHTGLFLQSGYDSYEFSHKSLQEYLCSDYILKLPRLPNWQTLAKIPSECALIVSLSSNPEIYFCEIIFKVMREMIIAELAGATTFIESFFNRLFIEKPNLSSGYLISAAILYLHTLCKIYEIYNPLFFEKLVAKEIFSSSFATIKNRFKIGDQRDVEEGLFWELHYPEALKKRMLELVETEKLVVLYDNNFDKKIDEFSPQLLLSEESWINSA